VAGRRAGLAGERSGLWFEFYRIAAQLHPRWLVIENVPGLLSSNGGRDFGVIVSGLVELGYGLAWRVLDAQYFGVAQRRRRVFVVGCLGDPVAAAQVLLEPESCGGNPAPRREAPQDSAGSLGSQPSGGGWRDDTDRMMFVAGTLGAEHGRNRGLGLENEADMLFVANTLPSYSGGGTRYEPTSDTFLVAHSLRAEGADASEDGTGRGTPLVPVAEPLDASYAKTTDSAGSNGAGPRNVVLGVSANQRGEVRERPVHGSLNGSKSGKQYDGVMADMSVRRLTPTECERLQGFPDGWTETGWEVQDPWIRLRESQVHQLANAGLVAAVDALSTGSRASASCIGNDSDGLVLLISRLDWTDASLRAPSAVALSVSMAAEAGAPVAISPGSGTATPARRHGELPRDVTDARDMRRPPVGEPVIALSLRLSSDGLSERARSSITSTWTNGTMTPATSGSTQVGAPTTLAIIRWSDSPPPSSSEASFALRLARTCSVSDSARYRMLGNAVCVPVAEWIGRQLLHHLETVA
jgi:DNA (cytosine-5)-methyltransferase 1